MTTVPQRDEWRSFVDAPVAAVSGAARYVAFASYAQLVPADTNKNRDIYVLDRASGSVTLESVTPAGSAMNGDSGHPSISDDGRFLVYQSAVALHERAQSIVILRDRSTGAVTIVGADATPAWSDAPVISRDGRFIAFVSPATNLVPGPDANGPDDDVYVFSAATRTIERVSVDRSGLQPPTGASFAPAISGDGRYVAFTSTAPLDPSMTAGPGELLPRRRSSQIYVHDRLEHVTRLVTATRDRQPADGPAWRPAIDAVGRYVAFVSTAVNLTDEDRTPGADVFVADLERGGIELISRCASGGPGNGPSASPVLSADGRLVVFQSEASDLVCARDCGPIDEDVNLLWDVLLFDRRARRMTRVSGGAAGGWLEPSVGPALDATGSVIAFSSRHPIDAADTKNDFDLFISTLTRF